MSLSKASFVFMSDSSMSLAFLDWYAEDSEVLPERCFVFLEVPVSKTSVVLMSDSSVSLFFLVWLGEASGLLPP